MYAVSHIPKNKLKLSKLAKNIGRIAIHLNSHRGNMEQTEFTIIDVIQDRFYLGEIKTKFGDRYKECFFPEECKFKRKPYGSNI